RRYVDAVPHREVSGKIFETQVALEEEKRREILARNGPENVYLLHDELAAWMVNNATVKRNNKDLARTMDKIKELRERTKKISLADTSRFSNQSYLFASQF